MLEHDGGLLMNKVGLGKPGDEFLVRHMFNLYHFSNQTWQQIAQSQPWGVQSIPVVGSFWPGPSVDASDIQRLVRSEGDRYPILTVVGMKFLPSPHFVICQVFEFCCREERLQISIGTPLSEIPQQEA